MSESNVWKRADNAILVEYWTGQVLLYSNGKHVGMMRPEGMTFLRGKRALSKPYRDGKNTAYIIDNDAMRQYKTGLRAKQYAVTPWEFDR